MNKLMSVRAEKNQNRKNIPKASQKITVGMWLAIRINRISNTWRNRQQASELESRIHDDAFLADIGLNKADVEATIKRLRNETV